jgi:beta-lactamase class D
MRICFAILLAFAIATLRAEVVCTAVADAASGKLLKQEGICDKRVTPASSFKIAISLMGYDSGFLKDEHAPALPFQEGYPDWNPAWRATTDPASWIKNSVVWYSQQITKWLGEDRFQRYVQEFRYGNQDVSGDPGKHNGLTNAWLSSSLKISPLEQIAFLEKVVRRQLPVTAMAYEMTSRVTAIGAPASDWEIHGKPGTGFPMNADGSVDSDHAVGWFVGWAKKNGRTWVFARLIQDEKPESVNAGLRARDAFLAELPMVLEPH